MAHGITSSSKNRRSEKNKSTSTLEKIMGKFADNVMPDGPKSQKILVSYVGPRSQVFKRTIQSTSRRLSDGVLLEFLNGDDLVLAVQVREVVSIEAVK